jgi:GNAT superfamily N-acetyltransferase
MAKVKKKSDVTVSSDRELVSPAAAAALYIELGWGTEKAYSAARMKKSLANCDIVISAWDAGGELVGIARVLSDFATTTKIIDIVIVPEYQHQGIGARMMRKIDLLTKGTDRYGETERKNFGFIEGCGYAKRKGLTVFVKKANTKIA